MAKEIFLKTQLVKRVHPLTSLVIPLRQGLASFMAGYPSISLKGLITTTGALLPDGEVGPVGSIATKDKSV